jgi:uncharacterized protein
MSASIDADIDAFLAGSPFAVAGASNARHKYGNRVLRCYWRAEREAIPIHPAETSVEGAPCYPNLAAAPQPIHAVSIITPPEVSAQIVDDALALGIRFLWFQPGAEHRGAIERARRAGCVVISDGPCLLVVLGWREG